MMNGMLNGKEAAKKLGVSEPTVWRIVKSEAIDHVRIGRRILFTEEAIQEYIRKNTFKARRNPDGSLIKEEKSDSSNQE